MYCQLFVHVGPKSHCAPAVIHNFLQTFIFIKLNLGLTSQIKYRRIIEYLKAGEARHAQRDRGLFSAPGKAAHVGIPMPAKPVEPFQPRRARRPRGNPQHIGTDDAQGTLYGWNRGNYGHRHDRACRSCLSLADRTRRKQPAQEGVPAAAHIFRRRLREFGRCDAERAAGTGRDRRYHARASTPGGVDAECKRKQFKRR